MADATPIQISAADLLTAGTHVAGHLQTAAIAPLHDLPAPVASSPVDAAAAGAVTAMHTKMTAMSTKLATKSSELQATTTTSAAAMQAQDANNASPLKDLASAVSSTGSGGSGAGTMGGGSSQGRIQAVDRSFKTDGSDPIKIQPHPTPPQVITMPDAPNPPPPIQGFPKCDTGEVLKRESEVLFGGLTAGAGLSGGPLSAAAGIGSGGWMIEDGIDALEKCK
jgi:hypothetical protein